MSNSLTCFVYACSYGLLFNILYLLQKQVGQFTKVVSHVWEIISKGREDWEGESMRSAGIQKVSMQFRLVFLFITCVFCFIRNAANA